MPYINIYEIDNTGDQQAYQTTVFVPGDIELTTFKTLGGDTFALDSNGCYLIKPIDGDEDVVLSNLPTDLKDDTYITEIIKAGLCVLYKYYATISADKKLAVDFLLDKNEYDIKFLTAGQHLALQNYFDSNRYTTANPQPYGLMGAAEANPCTLMVETTETYVADKYYVKTTESDTDTYRLSTEGSAPSHYFKLNSALSYYTRSGSSANYTYSLVDTKVDGYVSNVQYYVASTGLKYYTKSDDSLEDTTFEEADTIVKTGTTYYTEPEYRYYCDYEGNFIEATPAPTTETFSDGTYYTRTGSGTEQDPYVYTLATTFTSGTTYYVNEAIDPTLVKSLLDVCYKRGDCCVIGSGGTLTDSDGSALEDLKKSIDYIGAAFIDEDGTDLGKYFALFGAKVTLTDTTTLPDLAYLKAFGNAIANNNTWEALANRDRGTIETFSESAIVSKYDLDNLVMNKGGRSFNGMIKLNPQATKGAVIWGDRTLLDNGKNTKSFKATSFLSIRNMISDIAKRAYQSAIASTYETNNEVTWTNFKGRIATLLDEMISDYKIANYQIIRKKTNYRAEIACQIHIAPYGPVESFDIGIVLNNTQLTVEE